MAYFPANYYNFGRAFLSYLALITIISSSEVPRPRGVSLSRAPLYNPEKDFACFDGSLTIPFTHINDDYCDCQDGSDEPGTSACPNGIFHCTNAGHKPLNIAASRVNDGICDCCDGSDEYGNERAGCVDNCDDLGRSAREEAQKRAELVKAGKQLRAELIQRGIQLKQEKKDQLGELEKSRAEAEKVRAEKEALKGQVEELENAALAKYREVEEEERRRKAADEAEKNESDALEKFNLLDSNGDGKLDVSELQARKTFDQDRDGEVSEVEAKYFLNKAEVEFEEFLADCWSKVKPYMLIEDGFYKPPVEEKGAGEQEELFESEAEDVDEHEHSEGDHDDIDGDEQDQEDHDEQEDEDEEEAATTAKPPDAEPAVKYDEETQGLIDRANHARQEFSDAEKETNHIQRQVKDIQDYLEKDFGPEEEFATLDGQCFEYTDYEYVYRLCPFNNAVQKPKSSSTETRLGVWSKWMGPDDDHYSMMLYDRGQSCWNGPQRSTQVRLSCGGENKVTGVSEPNRCEYLFDFVSPAACKDAQAETSDDIHDEL